MRRHIYKVIFFLFQVFLMTDIIDCRNSGNNSAMFIFNRRCIYAQMLGFIILTDKLYFFTCYYFSFLECTNKWPFRLLQWFLFSMKRKRFIRFILFEVRFYSPTDHFFHLIV